MHVPPPGWSQVSEKGQQSGGAGGSIPVIEHLVQLFETDVEACNVVAVVEVGCVVVEVGCVGIVVDVVSDVIGVVGAAVEVDVGGIVDVGGTIGLQTPVSSSAEQV